jgi:hypothetical protein
MHAISAIWVLFVVIFGVLAFRHSAMSRQEVQPVRLNPDGEPRVGVILGIPTSQKDIDEFVRRFNAYIDEYNRNSKRQNLLAAVGYAAAALTAVISAILSLGSSYK